MLQAYHTEQVTLTDSGGHRVKLRNTRAFCLQLIGLTEEELNEYERAEEELGKSAFDEDRRDEGDRKTMEVWPSKKVLKKLERKKLKNMLKMKMEEEKEKEDFAKQENGIENEEDTFVEENKTEIETGVFD